MSNRNSAGGVDRQERMQQRDSALSERFAQLRRVEASAVPAVPDIARLAAATSKRSAHFSAPSLALAASALVASVMLWNVLSPEPDAARLYSDIMSGSSMTTDPLLMPTYGVAPETISLPGILELPAGEFGEASRL